MGGYADYALATRVPALWAQMQRDQAQKRTGDLAKNMFAQLQGLDPQSKEYFQRMRQLGMESGDDTLYQTGEGLNKAQQGYVFDDPMLTGHWKDFLLEGGDPNDKNAFAIWNDRRASQSGTKVNITMPGQPGFDWDAPAPLELLDKARANGAPVTLGMTYRNIRDAGITFGDLPSSDQSTAGGNAVELSNEFNRLGEIISDPAFQQRSSSDQVWDATLGMFSRKAPEEYSPIISKHQSTNTQKLAQANAVIEEIVTKIKTGAAATEAQTANFKKAYSISEADMANPKLLQIKLDRINTLRNAQNAIGKGFVPQQTDDGRILLGQKTDDKGRMVYYIVDPATGKIDKMTD